MDGLSIVVTVEDVADALISKLIHRQRIKIGNGLEEDVFLGPVIRMNIKRKRKLH